jgi:hypothetical protein
MDYAVAVGSFAWGVQRFVHLGRTEWVTSTLWVASALLGLFLARWNPAARFQGFIEKRFVRRGRALPAEAGPYPEPPNTPYQPRPR